MSLQAKEIHHFDDVVESCDHELRVGDVCDVLRTRLVFVVMWVFPD